MCQPLKGMSDVSKGPALVDLAAAHGEEVEQHILSYPDSQVPVLCLLVVIWHKLRLQDFSTAKNTSSMPFLCLSSAEVPHQDNMP